MSIKNQDALDERANNLEANGLNGLKLILVSLPNSSEAHIEVYFYNSREILNILNDFNSSPSTDKSDVAKRIFPLSGGHRVSAGSGTDQVKTVEISSGHPNTNSLILTVKPIGDYSTYTLAIDYQNMDPIFSEIDFKFRPGCFNFCSPDWESAPTPKEDPAIDYLAKDYDSFKHTMIAAMRERVHGWEPTSEADLDQVLLEMFSVAADELSDYQDRVMNEAYLGTARKRVSLARHARLMDYHIHQGTQASTWLTLKLDNDQEFNLPKPNPNPMAKPIDLKVWAGSNDINAPSSVVFITRTQQHFHYLLNQMGLYTWSDSIPSLAAGSTTADLKLLTSDNNGNLNPITDKDKAIEVQKLIRDGKITHLLIQEWKNPATGEEPGKDPTKRQLLKLLPGEDGAKADFDPLTATTPGDPLTAHWFVRVHWEEKDKLKNNYCFTVNCPVPKGKIENISLFHGNLIEVYHGRPVEVVFKEPGTESLFLFALELSFQNALDGGNFSNDLRNKFREHNITLSINIEVLGNSKGWLISDKDSKKVYSIIKSENQLEVYSLHRDDFSDYERTKKWGTICKLPEGPLAYKNTLPESKVTKGEVAPESTLEVEVETPGGGIDRWDEVISLIHSDNSDEQGDHFIVETDEEGKSIIRFGNSTNGKEIPEGANVHCSYQVGRGLDGNVGADTLVNFDRAFQGIKECWNPFDVTNGTAPEPIEEIIRRVPEAYRFRQLRAVTLKDYIDRVEELPYVSKAAARYAWTGSWRTVQIAIDPAGTTELTYELRIKITRHLDAVRLIGEDLEIRPPRFVPLKINVSLCIHPDHWPEDIEYILEQEFSDGFTPDGRIGFFHPDLWTFGRELRESQIIGRVQSVEGVDHVTSVIMKRWSEATPGTEDIITVRANEIIQVKNNRDHMEKGFIFFDVKGGRR
jgi:hypothetical protein